MKNPTLYTIRTKPITYERVESHTEQDIKDWFKDYRQTLEKYRIKKLKRILNIDKSSTRITYLKREKVIVLITVKEIYALSPENRQSVTIVKTIFANVTKEPLLPFIICLGKQIIEN